MQNTLRAIASCTVDMGQKSQTNTVKHSLVSLKLMQERNFPLPSLLGYEESEYRLLKELSF